MYRKIGGLVNSGHKKQLEISSGAVQIRKKKIQNMLKRQMESDGIAVDLDGATYEVAGNSSLT